MKNYILLSCILLLSACGFKPIYSAHNTEINVNHALSQIEIKNIPDRSGQFLRNALIDRFYHKGRPQNAIYFLNVTPIEEQLTDLDITQSADATRAQLHLKTHVTLTDIESGRELFTRTLNITASYNILINEFATHVSEQNTRENALNDLARQIELQIGRALR